jgi:hypothetical protein
LKQKNDKFHQGMSNSKLSRQSYFCRYTIAVNINTPRVENASIDDLLTRLVALNIERRDEERRGHVRWLRPDYQIPKLGHKVKSETADMDVTPIITEDAPAWPSDGLDQIKIVRELLARADAPVLQDAITRSFKQKYTAKRHDRVGQVLDTLVAAGVARTTEGDGYFLPR